MVALSSAAEAAIDDEDEDDCQSMAPSLHGWRRLAAAAESNDDLTLSDLYPDDDESHDDSLKAMVTP